MSSFATPSPSKISRYSRYGSWQVLAEAQFQRGLVTDTAPVALPAGAVVDASDYLFDRPGKLRKRGGTSYAGSALGTATSIVRVSAVTYQAGPKLIAETVESGNHYLWDVYGPASAGPYLTGQTNPSTNPGILYNDRLYFLWGAMSSTGRPRIVVDAAGTCTASDSVAPVAAVGCVHAGYLVVANDQGAHQNRLWFSPIPDAETTWDTSNAYIDTNGPIYALASIQGVLLVFHGGSIERVLGSIPPGTVGENMSLQPLSGQAGAGAPSIRSVGGNLYFADDGGIWVTNGAAVTSISSRADGTGISSLWRTTIKAARAAGGTLSASAGTYGNDYYMLAVAHQPTAGAAWVSDLFLCYHLATGIWSRFVVEPLLDFTAAPWTLETYAAPGNQGRLVALGDLFAETPLNAADANGAAVLPQVTSRVMGQGPFEKAWGDGHLTYDMRSSAGATLALTFSRDIEQQTFQPSFTFAGVAAATRQRFPISGDGHGFSWRIAQTGASSKTELYAVEVEHRNYEEQADG